MHNLVTALTEPIWKEAAREAAKTAAEEVARRASNMLMDRFESDEEETDEYSQDR